MTDEDFRAHNKAIEDISEAKRLSKKHILACLEALSDGRRASIVAGWPEQKARLVRQCHNATFNYYNEVEPFAYKLQNTDLWTDAVGTYRVPVTQDTIELDESIPYQDSIAQYVNRRVFDYVQTVPAKVNPQGLDQQWEDRQVRVTVKGHKQFEGPVEKSVTAVSWLPPVACSRLFKRFNQCLEDLNLSADIPEATWEADDLVL